MSAVGCGQPLMASAATASDPKLRFAKVVGVRPETLSEFRRVLLPKGGAVAEVWLGIGEVSGDPQPWLVPVSAAGITGAAMRLPIASMVDVLASVDLAGPPKQIDLSAAPASPGGVDSANAGAAPALLLRATLPFEGGNRRESLVLVSLAEQPAVVWRETATLIRARQQGYRSFSLQFVADPGQPWLALHLFQTTLPATGQTPAMPGPPLLLKFGYREGSYRRIG